jgi:hypothetical protein
VSDDGFAYEEVEESSDSDVDESAVALSPQLSTSSKALPAAASRSLFARDKRRSADTEHQPEPERQREHTDSQGSAVGLAKVLENGDTRLQFKARGQLGIKFGKDAAGHCIITGLVNGGLAETMCTRRVDSGPRTVGLRGGCGGLLNGLVEDSGGSESRCCRSTTLTYLPYSRDAVTAELVRFATVRSCYLRHCKYL